VADNILIIERVLEVGDAIKNMATATGSHATAVCTLDAALTELSRHHYDIIMTSRVHISSLKMVSFPWLAKQIQPDAFVVLTSAGEPIEISDIKTIDAHLSKPFSIAGMVEAFAKRPHRAYVRRSATEPKAIIIASA